VKVNTNFWKTSSNGKKKIVVVLSKIDILETDTQLVDVKNFVTKNFKDLLEIEPLIFPVSSKLALNAKLGSVDTNSLINSTSWKKSRFGELEAYISKTLTREERSKLKLENPIGIAEHLMLKYNEVIKSRSKILGEDLKSLQHIQSQIEEYKKNMMREFKFQETEIVNALLQMSKRGEEYLEETLRFGKVLQFFNSGKIKEDFEKEIVVDTTTKIERQVNDIIDSILQKNSKMWKDSMDYLQRKVNVNASDLVGQVNSSFEYDRASLIKSLGNSANTIILSFDRKKEAEKLSQQMKSALLGTAVVEVGAIGLGTIFAASLLDLTGFLISLNLLNNST